MPNRRSRKSSAAINNSTDYYTGQATGIWKATNLNPAATNLGAFSVVPSEFTTSTDKISVQSLNVGANYNNMQVNFETVSSLSGSVKAVAGYDSANNVFTIQVKNSEAAADKVTLQDIVDAINLIDGFAGSYTSKTAAAGVSQSAGIIFGKSVDATAVGNTGRDGRQYASWPISRSKSDRTKASKSSRSRKEPLPTK